MPHKTAKKCGKFRTLKWELMQLIYLDLEIDRPEFIEDPTFNVIPNIEDFIDANFDVLDEDEIDEEQLFQETGKKRNSCSTPKTKKILIWH